MARHDEKPEKGDLPTAEIEKAMAQISSPYGQRVRALLEEIEGKVVARTSTGRSGYCLEFTDGSWVVCYLAESLLDWRTGPLPLPQGARDLMHNSSAGDARGPLTIDRPYASEVCDLEFQVAHAIGQSVSGIAVGDNSFNLCFPDGHELDATVVSPGSYLSSASCPTTACSGPGPRLVVSWAG